MADLLADASAEYTIQNEYGSRSHQVGKFSGILA